MPFKDPSLTFGIEEEYHLVDLDTRRLADTPRALLKELHKALGPQVSPEFLKSQIEIGTRPVASFGEARAELIRLRGGIATAAARYGLAPIAAGSHPFSTPDTTERTEKRRYRELDRDFAGAIRGMSVCGMHVHAGIEDDDLRIDLMNQARYFLPHMLALSTSSPFWRGVDTGLKSYRKAVLRRLPRSGVPGLFSSWQEYQRTLAVLTDAGISADGTKFWWDLRPSARFPTLEVRVADVCPFLEDTLAIAALYLCFLRMLVRHRHSNLKWRTYPICLIEENMWRAQRYGVTGELLDLSKGALVPVAALLDEIEELTREDAAALGCTREMAHLKTIVARGTSAERQIQAYEQALAAGASEAEALIAVTDMLISETVEGTGLDVDCAKATMLAANAPR